MKSTGRVRRMDGPDRASSKPRWRRRPGIDLPLCLVAGDAVALLYLADQLFALALNLIEVVVRQLAPLFAHFAFQLHPLALQRVFIHCFLQSPTVGSDTQRACDMPDFVIGRWSLVISRWSRQEGIR